MGELKIEQTEQIAELCDALARAQSRMGHAEKDRENTHFKSRYATLAAVLNACRPALSSEGIALLQIPGADGQGNEVIHTRLAFKGQWIQGTTPIRTKDSGMQAYGSAVTYAKRYALMAMCGIASDDDDDDGEGAEGRHREPAPRARWNGDNGPESPQPPRRDPEKDLEEAVRSAISTMKAATPETRENAKGRAWGFVVRALDGDQTAATEVWKTRVLAALRPAQPSPSTSSPSAPTPPDGVPPVLAPETADPLAAIVAEARAIAGTDGQSLDKISDCVRRVGQMRVAEDAKLRAVNDIRAHREGLFRGAKP